MEELRGATRVHVPDGARQVGPDRTSWFERMDGHTTALWWVCEGTRPSMEAALVRLKLLNTYGPSPRAFSLLHQFDSSGRRVRRRDR
ncbi:MAG: DUF3291 domain-containing protein [Actinomycetota bacterium]|nr:DUF3291 domain-containing protein [Actinomycetota bacterium]